MPGFCELALLISLIFADYFSSEPEPEVEIDGYIFDWDHDYDA